MTEPAPTILLVAPNWLGDAIMASPLLSRLAGSRDAAGRSPRVVLAVRDAWAPLFAGDPRVAALVPIERHGRHAGLAGIRRQGQDLRAARARAIVLGPPSLRAALAARLAGAPVRIGYRGDGRDVLLTHALPRPRRGSLHHGAELRALGDAALEACGLVPDGGAQERGWGLLPALLAAPVAAPAGPLWVLAPGATYGAAKEWPLTQACAFAARAVAERGVRLVLLGDGAAGPFAARVASGVPRADDGGGTWPGVVDLTGRTPLPEAARILRTASAFVGNDSGLMHLAGALGVPTVGIFGSTNPAWTAPLGPRVAVVAADGFPCRPCYRRTCNQPRFCLDTVGPDAVFAAIDRLTAATTAEELS